MSSSQANPRNILLPVFLLMAAVVAAAAGPGDGGPWPAARATAADPFSPAWGVP